jgi:iron(III) transport system permease protein
MRASEQTKPEGQRITALALGRMAAHLRARGWFFVAILIAAALVSAPLISLVAMALGANGNTGELWLHLARYVLPYAALETLLLLTGVGLLTAVVGIGAAWMVTLYHFPGRKLLVWLLALPLAMPTYITAYIYAELLETLGPVQAFLRMLLGYKSRADYWFPEVRSLGGAIFVISFVVYPYVYLAARSMFATQSASLIEVARTLGAGPWRLLRSVALPLARPALAVGLAFALLETLNDIGASEYLGVQTLTRAVATTWLNRGNLSGAAQIACILLVLVAGLIWLEAYGRRARQFATSTKRPRHVAAVRLSGWRAWVATALCAIPVIIGFAVPVGFLAVEVVKRGLRIDQSVIAATITTLLLASVASVLVIVLGLCVALGLRRYHDGTSRKLVQIAGLGYTIPGVVLALAILTPMVMVDNALSAIWQALGGNRLGLVITASSWAIIIAYVIRFLPIATGNITAGLSRISPSIDDAARILGANAGEITRRLHLPLARQAMAAAGLLVFIDCIKELPATLLLRPLNVETLSTQVYSLASQGRFEAGALSALLIVLAGLYPALQMARMSKADT